MSLIFHAKQELQAAGLMDQDSDYDGMLGEAVMELVTVFAAQGHSGQSAAMTLDLFQRVGSFKALTPITSDPQYWMKIDPDVAGEYGVHQSTRQSTLFSYDAGRTWYDLDDPRWRQKVRGWAFRWNVRRMRSGRSVS